MDKVAYLSVRNACNARCPMCLSWRSNIELPSPTVEDVLRKLADAGWDRVVFTGGEVVEVAEFERLLNLGASLGLRVGLVTNGTVFAEPFSRFLESPALDYLVYSRDLAGGAAHAKLRVLPILDDEIHRHLPVLRNRGVFLQLNTVLFPSSVAELSAIASSPLLRMFHLWHVIPVKGAMAASWDDSRRLNSVSVFKTLKEQAGDAEVVCPDPGDFARIPLADLRRGHYTAAVFEEGRYCKAQESLLYLDATGEVLPCNSILWEERGRATYGNVRSSSLDEILERKADQCLNRRPVPSAACASCDPLNVVRHHQAG